jgi:hypothetical protein
LLTIAILAAALGSGMMAGDSGRGALQLQQPLT